jgi:hypothetical protein
MIRLRENISEILAELETEILVEQKASCRSGDQLPFAVSRIGEAGADVVLGQFGEVAQDFLMGLAGGEPTEHIRDGNPHLPYARATAALTGFDRDNVMVVHCANIALFFVNAAAFSCPSQVSGRRTILIPPPHAMEHAL